MRKHLILSLLITVVFLGCGEDEPSEFFFRGELDGVEISTERSIGNRPADTNLEYIIAAQIIIDEIGLISINFPELPNEGSYTAKDDGIVFIIAEGEDLWTTSFTKEVGTVEITENNSEYIEGSCSFEVEHLMLGTKRVFTNGSFRAQKI